MPIQITARRDGFRRLGIAHSAKTTTYDDDRFTADELSILENDPNLIVLRTDGTQGSENDEALVKASARINELEAGMTKLRKETDELIDKHAAEIKALTAERDELQAKLTAAVKDGKDSTQTVVEDTSGKKKG